MRYYNVVLTNPTTGALIQPEYLKGLGIKSSYTSFVSNQTLPGALNVELDIPISTYANPRQGAYFRIWGVSIQELGQASDLNGVNISIYAGMQKGLPLAKPAQSGVIVQGSIFQAFGNWVGTDMTIDFELLPPMGTQSENANIVIDWKAGASLTQALQSALKVAFPTFTVTTAISPNLVLSHDQKGYYATLNEFASYVFDLSQSIIGGSYMGVSIVVYGNTILCYDGTQPYGATSLSKPTQIAFEDLIGQPTWITAQTINFKTVMRADIHVGDYIKLPTTLASPYVLTSSNAAYPGAPARNKSIFQGTFLVQEVHHFGNYRQPDAASWNTTFDAVAVGGTT